MLVFYLNSSTWRWSVIKGGNGNQHARTLAPHMGDQGQLQQRAPYLVQLMPGGKPIKLLYDAPQIWLPVRLVQGRIENEIKANLSAVRRYAESKHAKQGSALRQ